MKNFINPTQRLQRSPDYFDLTGPNGTEDNIGGIVTTAYYAPISDFTDIAEVDAGLSDTYTDYMDLATISGDHTFGVGKGFNKMYNTQNSGSVEYSAQGERDGYSLKTTAKFFYPGMKADFLGWIRKIKNDRIIWMFKTVDDVLLQVGSKKFPAYVRIDKGGTATNESGRRGFEFIVESMGSGPEIYTGALTLS